MGARVLNSWRLLAAVGVPVFVLGCLRPVLGDWSGSVLGPFGGLDAVMQAGILKWSALHWHHPAAWLDLPIFAPLPGMLGCMDPLLGQAWLVWPLHLALDPTAPALYNLAMAGSLLLAAAGMAALWRATGGRWCDSGPAALALLGAPYTTAQLGHLNQLPPPFVLLTLAAVFAALRAGERGRGQARWWWAVGAALVLQAAWGWYGFAYAAIGVVVLKLVRLADGARAGESTRASILGTARAAWLPALAAAGLVWLIAQPQLRLSDRYPQFTRAQIEVRIGSADIQHVANLGAYRSGPADWLGRGDSGEQRYDGKARQVLNPGWIALALAAYGWSRRRGLDEHRRRDGRALLILGLVGMVLAFGDSVGLPFTDRRLPLPLEWLRSAVPPFQAFRGAWRFCWLMVIAVAWWAGVGVAALAEGRCRWAAPAAVLVLLLVSLPAGVPARKLPLAGRPLAVAGLADGPVLTLPAPVDEYAEDPTEALWVARALELGRPLTGGSTGWVPPPIVAFRERLHRCETGLDDPLDLIAELRAQGFAGAELAWRPDDEIRRGFWREALLAAGAVRTEAGAPDGYETYAFPAAR